MSNGLPAIGAFAGTFATCIGAQLLTLISGVLVARSLHAEGRGILAAVQIWPGLFAAVGLLGVNYSLALRAAKARGNVLPLARAGVGLGLAVSALIFGALWLIGPLLLPSSVPNGVSLTRLYLLVVPCTILTAYLQSIDQGAGKLKSYNLTRFAFNVAYVISVLFCWVVGSRYVEWFVASLLIAGLVAFVIRIHLTGWICLLPSFAFSEWHMLVKEGFPFFVANAVQIAKEYLDRLILLYVLGPHDLGVYAIAATAAGAHTALGKSVNNVVLPRSGALSLEAAARDAARIFRVMALVSGAISVAAMAVLPFLIPLFFGPSFESAILPATILVLSQYFGCQGAIIDEGLRGQVRPFVGMIACTVSLASLVAVALPFARWWGVTGVAIAAVCSQTIYCGILFNYLYRKFKSDLLPVREDVRFLWSTTLTVCRLSPPQLR